MPLKGSYHQPNYYLGILILIYSSKLLTQDKKSNFNFPRYLLGKWRLNAQLRFLTQVCGASSVTGYGKFPAKKNHTDHYSNALEK